MRDSLDFAKTQVKPANPKVTDSQKSNHFVEKIIQAVIDELPLKKVLGFIRPKWFKVEFQTGPGSIGGPYFYPKKNTSISKREIIELSNEAQQQISKCTKELHELELKDYNWNTLEIVAYEDGRHEANRTFYDFDTILPLTSTPEGA